MDTQTTALAALLTSIIYMAAPSPKAAQPHSELLDAVASIKDSTKKTDMIMESLQDARPETAGPNNKE
tara:strand:- start:1717 stop:1920 length:204 start_codon:yes stop_codon:yes gene_type:complete